MLQISALISKHRLDAATPTEEAGAGYLNQVTFEAKAEENTQDRGDDDGAAAWDATHA